MSNYQPQAGDVVAGRYELQSQLGHGGFAIVFLATDQQTGQQYAVKHPRYQRFGGTNADSVIDSGFQREVDLLEEVTDAGGHPNVIGLQDTLQHRGLDFIVVELIDGEDLDEIVNNQPFNPNEARQIVIELADVIHFLHENEIVYRDLKPDNIMRTNSGDLKLIDLNAASKFEADPSANNDGSTKFGSSQWYPKEVTQDKNVLDPLPLGPHTDVYSMGKFLFFLITGNAPRGNGVRPADFGIDAPGYLGDILESATQEHPQDRYNNSLILKRALENKDPVPPKQARIRRVAGPQQGARHDISPGDTLGRKGTNPPPAIPIRDDEEYISAVQVEFDTDNSGNWYLKDKSTNGTYVNKGNGWQQVLSQRGRRRQQQQGRDVPSNLPSEIKLDRGDMIAFVHPSYGVTCEFLG